MGTCKKPDTPINADEYKRYREDKKQFDIKQYEDCVRNDFNNSIKQQFRGYLEERVSDAPHYFYIKNTCMPPTGISKENDERRKRPILEKMFKDNKWQLNRLEAYSFHSWIVEIDYIKK